EMLNRFESVMSRTAPGIVFIGAVVHALTGAAPEAKASIAGGGAVAGAAKSGAGKTGAFLAVLGKAPLVGALLTSIVVVLLMKHLEPYHDDEEERQLNRFRKKILWIMVPFAVVFSV